MIKDLTIQFFVHPNRFVQSFLGKYSRLKEEKRQKFTEDFEIASLLRDSKGVKKNYRKLNGQHIPISIRVKYLEQLKYEKNKEELLLKYAELKSKYQGNLEVLLPYLKLVCELKEWDIAERLGQEILRINPSHPDGLEGLRQFNIARKDWVACIKQEKELLKKFSGSFQTNDLPKEHEFHLQEALRQDPNCLKNWSFSYLPSKKGWI